MKCTIWFDVQQLYYFPQYLPVIHELVDRGFNCGILIYKQDEIADIVESFVHSTDVTELLQKGRSRVAVLPAESVFEFYCSEKPEWIFFGNGCDYLDHLPRTTKTALLYHGIGVKSCYYGPELARFNVRFVEGAYRLRELEASFPSSCFVMAGFPKLDPFFRACNWAPSLFQAGVQQKKEVPPRLLYAPTFYPSSIECMDSNWPALFRECEIVIKPHFFSMTLPKYVRHKELLKQWESFGNVTIVPTSQLSLVPHMAAADVLISEASSALFEFAALGRPVVWLDFLKLRWSYRGPLHFRFKKRMDQKIYQYADIAAHARRPKDLQSVVRKELEMPSRLEQRRCDISRELIGETDGMASVRIADWITSN